MLTVINLIFLLRSCDIAGRAARSVWGGFDTPLLHHMQWHSRVNWWNLFCIIKRCFFKIKWRQTDKYVVAVLFSVDLPPRAHPTLSWIAQISFILPTSHRKTLESLAKCREIQRHDAPFLRIRSFQGLHKALKRAEEKGLRHYGFRWCCDSIGCIIARWYFQIKRESLKRALKPFSTGKNWFWFLLYGVGEPLSLRRCTDVDTILLAHRNKSDWS